MTQNPDGHEARPYPSSAVPPSGPYGGYSSAYPTDQPPQPTAYGQPGGGQEVYQAYPGATYGQLQQYGSQRPPEYGAPGSMSHAPIQYAYQVQPKSPGLMLLASFFIPGLGSILNGETSKGVGILIGFYASVFLAFLLVPILAMLGLWIWGMVDAYQGAQRWNAAHGIIS